MMYSFRKNVEQKLCFIEIIVIFFFKLLTCLSCVYQQIQCWNWLKSLSVDFNRKSFHTKQNDRLKMKNKWISRDKSSFVKLPTAKIHWTIKIFSLFNAKIPNSSKMDVFTFEISKICLWNEEIFLRFALCMKFCCSRRLIFKKKIFCCCCWNILYFCIYRRKHAR